MPNSAKFIVHVFRIENCWCLQNFIMLGYYFLNLHVPVAIWTRLFLWWRSSVATHLCYFCLFFLTRKSYNKKQQLGVLYLRTHCCETYYLQSKHHPLWALLLLYPPYKPNPNPSVWKKRALAVYKLQIPQERNIEAYCIQLGKKYNLNISDSMR